MSLEVHRGNNKKLKFTIEDSDGNPIDLTQSDTEVNFVVSDQLPADTKVIDKDATGLSSDGTCEVIVTKDDTDIDARNYFYEVWVNVRGSDPYTAEVGKLLVRKRVDS